MTELFSEENILSQTDQRELLGKCHVIAVVGLSADSTRESFLVASYLKRCGFRIIPVNPNVSSVLGEKSYSSLIAIPPGLAKTIDIVDVFRKSEDVLPIVEQAVELKKKFGHPVGVWLQRGIINEAAAALASQAGLVLVMDSCLMHVHRLIHRES